MKPNGLGTSQRRLGPPPAWGRELKHPVSYGDDIPEEAAPCVGA